MKFVFFGTPYVASDTLEILNKHQLLPSLVVTNPDRPRGRKQIITPSETKVWATNHNIPVITPEKIDQETISKIREQNADIGIVVAYGKILPEELLNIFPHGVINVHYSLLPKYRGASPVEQAILNGEKETGVTIQQMVKDLDAGDIIDSVTTKIDDKDTTTTLRERLIESGAELLVSILPVLLNNKTTPIPQDTSKVTHASKIQKSDGELLPEDSDETKWNKYRAYSEWPGTYFFENEKRIKVIKAEMDENRHFKILRVVPEGKKETDYPLSN